MQGQSYCGDIGHEPRAWIAEWLDKSIPIASGLHLFKSVTTDPPRVAGQLDTNTDKLIPTKSLRQWESEQQSRRMGLGDSLTMLDALL